ncbi:MAG: alpha-L-rhamnosidase N-terminal domain-containing protein [Opitutales bacterium]|nr:alpha-L-rhamnosidase N-terminal domain-containing protein [Opitutales bacterium]
MKKIIYILLFFIVLSVSGYGAEYEKPVVETNKLWENVPSALKKANWMWPGEGSWGYDITHTYAGFRKSFDIKKLPPKAAMYITADATYRLYVNGKFVCNGPARGYQRSWPYDEVDVSKYLQIGKNVIAVRVHNPGRHTFSYVFEGRAGVLFALDMGNDNIVISDSKIKCRRLSGYARTTAPYSVQRENQEHVDLRIENPEWILPAFDDSSWDTGTKWAKSCYNAMPYYTFEERMIPMNEYKIIPMKTLVAEGEGKSIDDSDNVHNVAKLIALEGEKLQNAIEKQQEYFVVSATSKGMQRSYLIDFGRVNVGIPIFKVEGAKGGEIVDIVFTEYYTDGFDIDNPYNVGSMRSMANRMICREGDFTHEFHSLQGFRYMLVRVRNNSSQFKITPTLRWAAYPHADKGVFKVSNENAQKIWNACKHTQKICSLDAYVDTPFREQAQWWGDARVQAWNSFFISGDTKLLRRGIKSIAMQQVPNGLTYGHAPTFPHSCILPDFSLTWIMTLWDYYWQTGSIEPYLTHKKVVDGIVSYFENMIDERTGLVKYDKRYWLFLDWTGIQKGGQPAILNHWYLQAMDKLVRLCRENNLQEDAKRYERIARNIRKSIETHLIDKDGLAVDGVFENGKQNKLRSIQAQIVSRMNNIAGHNFEKAKNEIILPYLREDLKTHAEPSSFWVVYVFKTMIDAGYEKDVYNFIMRRWKQMGEYGTTFENYDASKMSHSHAWTAHPAFILPQILGGIKQLSAGWKKVSISPSSIEDSYEIVYPTPLGDIKIKKSTGGKAEIDVPSGIEVVEN